MSVSLDFKQPVKIEALLAMFENRNACWTLYTITIDMAIKLIRLLEKEKEKILRMYN